MSFFNQKQIEKIISFALEAGEIAKKYFKSPNLVITTKSDKSKVTEADIAISKFLNKKLSEEFLQIPIICEEGNLREIRGDVFWLIDPIDGTSSFIEGNVEFAINIALVQKQKAIFGLIYSPLFENAKMILSNQKDEILLYENGIKKQIIKPFHPDKSKLSIITSLRTKDVDIQNYVTEFYPEFLNNFSVEKISSAIKFLRLIEGKSNLYLHFRKSMEWDTAAGQALVELIGGKVKNFLLNHDKIIIDDNLLYRKTNFNNQSFMAEI